MTGATKRLFYRTTGFSQKRPDPPRQIEYDSSTGMLKWLAPRDTMGITHWRIRVNTDTGDPHIQIPVGQMSAVIPVAATAWVSAYNAPMDLESVQVSGAVAASISGGGYYTASFSASYTPNLANGYNQDITLTADITINAPVNGSGAPAAGDWLELTIRQDTTGGWLVTWDAVFVGQGDLNTDASTYSKLFFKYNGTKWELSGASVTGVAF